MITTEMLNSLRETVSKRLTRKRYNHTIGVEKMARFLAENCLPDKINEVSVAALLHDITKEFDKDTQIRILRAADNSSQIYQDIEPAVLHSFTAPIIVKKEFSDFASADILSAVKKHTLGDEVMSVFDKIIFLADFIEEGRIYPDSVLTRKFVTDSMKPGDAEKNIEILNRACIMEMDSTISHLESLGKPANPITHLAKKSILSKM